jgi:alkanesulfonate monooxygenase SsuD/methylene tetrahydromethanopterin reductase-like flavin-dependent oxidoreductase (luciferase family)
VSASTATELSACGTPALVRNRLDEYLAAGATSVVVAPFGQPIEKVANALVETWDVRRF